MIGIKPITDYARKIINKDTDIEPLPADILDNPDGIRDLYGERASSPLPDQDILHIAERIGEFGYKRTEPVGGISVPFMKRKVLPAERPKLHDGIDILAEPGTPVAATLEGKVVEIQHGFGKEPSGKYEYSNEGAGKFGNYIVLEHEIGGKTIRTKYAHLDGFIDMIEGYVSDYHAKEKILLDKDKQIPVGKGQIIGKSGMTGNAANEAEDTAHLHYEIHEGIKGRTYLVNPQTVMAGIKVVKQEEGNYGR